MPEITEVLRFVGLIFLNVLKATWWIILLLFLFSKVKPLYLRYQQAKFLKKIDWVLLEIILPPDVQKTPKAMENVLEGLHGSWSPPGGMEKWREGALTDRFSLEIVGTSGRLHFYVRCKRKQRNFVESKIFAQYPDVEILEVKDYTEDISADVPGIDYDIWGADYVLNRPWFYPIRSYLEFEDIDEDRRMDSLSQYAELVFKMEKDEHMWLQLIISPVLTEVGKGAQNEVNRLVGRKVEDKYADPLTKILNAFSGFSAQSVENQKASPERQALTPGERDAVEKIELKESKIKFRTIMRGVYIARKDNWNSAHLASLHGHLRQFSGLNSFKSDSNSSPKSSLIFFKKTRNYMRKRGILNAYKNRFLKFVGSPYILSTEEIATLYHFPGRIVRAPFMPRVPSKRSEPPSNLPI